MRVFISYGCFNTLPQTTWLNTTEIFSVFSSGYQKSEIKVTAGPAPSKGTFFRGEFFLPAFPASGGPRCSLVVATLFQSLLTPALTRVGVKPLTLIAILVIACKALIIQGNLFVSKSLI